MKKIFNKKILVGILVAFSFLFMGSSKADAAITLINTSKVSDYTGTLASSIALPATSLTTGNFIVVATRWLPNSSTITSITDTAGNTYVKAIGRTATSSGTRVEMWYAYNVTGNASNVVTITPSVNVQYYGVVASQYSGIKTAAAPLDTTAVGNATGTSVTSASFTTTQAYELIVSSSDFNSSLGPTWTAGTGYTIQAQDASGVETLQDKIVSSIQTSVTASITLSTSRGLSISVATFKGVSVKTRNGLSWASIKSIYGLAVASVKKANGLVAAQ